MGGVVGALQRRADRITDELTRRGQGPLILPTLLKLASVEGEEEPTRRRLRRSELGPQEQDVVDAFVEARLLTSSKSEVAGEEATVLEVAHEALLRQWLPLRRAIEEARTSLRMRSELERLAADWNQARRKHDNEDSYLLVRGRLAEFRHWADRHIGELGPIEGEFLRASEAFEERRIRRLRAVAGVLAVLLVIAVIATVLAIQQAQDARLEANIALARQLAAQSKQLTGDQDTLLARSVLLAVESMRRFTSEEADQALREALALVPRRVSTLNHESAVVSAVFSPDGEQVATASTDGTAKVWDATTGEEVAIMRHQGVVGDVAFSPDGKYIVTGSEDETARVWDATSGQEVTTMNHQGAVGDVAFNPDGEQVATASTDGTVRVWDAMSGEEVATKRHEDAVLNVSFSPEGKYVASASADGSVHVWPWRPEDLIHEACSRLKRNLSKEEWQVYLGDEPYRKTCPKLPIPR